MRAAARTSRTGRNAAFRRRICSSFCARGRLLKRAIGFRRSPVVPASSLRLTLRSSSSVRRSPDSILGLRCLRRVELDGFVDVDRIRREPKHREQHQARHEEKARRADVAPAPAGEIFAREKSRPEQERRERLPEFAVVGDVPAGRLAHELPERRQPLARVLAARRAIRVGRDRAAVGAAMGRGIGRAERIRLANGCAPSWAMRPGFHQKTRYWPRCTPSGQRPRSNNACRRTKKWPAPSPASPASAL